MRTALALVIALALGGPGLAVASTEETPKPCTSGSDVRNLTESNVPQSLKDKIFKNPGPVISTTSSSYPSGKMVVIRSAHPEWPINTAVTASYIDQIFFSTDAGTRSVRGYYSRNSWGSFQVTKGAIPAWIALSKKISEYTNGIEANSTYVADVLKLANVDWKSLDANHDKTVGVSEAQLVILVPNGPVFASTRGVSPGTVKTPQGTFTFATRKVVHFSLKANSAADKADNPIRALAAVNHELGHAFFNLPDYYGANTGTGEYDMMGSGNSSTWVHLTMPVKIKIGWITAKIVRGHLGTCLQFVSSALQKAALIVMPIDQLLATPLEYWVIENRNKKYDGGGYDDALPDAGLAVWYVSQGTYSSGHDDVRLVDFSKPDQDPDKYKTPGSNALFKLNPRNQRRVILDRKGQWNLQWFQRVSDVAGGSSPGLFMYAEF